MKKIISILLSTVLLLALLPGCSTTAPSSSGETGNGANSAGEPVVIRIGASITPHSEILKAADELLREKGYQLDIVEFDDYILPNLNVESGELDANFFQHRPYLNNFNEENDTHLVSVAVVHYEPFGLYPGKTTSLDSLADGAQISIPNDGTNEARALLLLQEKGYIKLKDGVGITATINDIAENPKNIEFKEIEAAQLPNTLKDVDYAIINSNYAIEAKLNPVKDSLIIEGSASAYGNILAVKQGNENAPKIKALKAALESKQVADYINNKYNGSVVSVVENPGDGYDSSVDYNALKGTTITVAASPAPHKEILDVAKEILAAKGVTLDIKEFTDYVQPNNVVENGEIDANYFQHTPYLDDFNRENGTHIVSTAVIHVEPMGLYGGKQTTLDALNK